jgi:hypothetical protein
MYSQDIAALTLAQDLRDLQLAQRTGAPGSRLPGVTAGPQPPCGYGPSGEWSSRTARLIGLSAFLECLRSALPWLQSQPTCRHL